MKLSSAEGLEWFMNIVLCSSHNDEYVPYESARIELCEKALRDKVRGNALIKMCNNLWNSIKHKSVYKLDIDFIIEKKKLDKMIGRAAHIEYLENTEWIDILLVNLPELFS